MVRVYSLFLLVLIIFEESFQSDNIRQVPTRLVKYEKLCWVDAYAYTMIGDMSERTRSKDVCGTKCMETIGCISFAYQGEKARCFVYNEKITNKTESCDVKKWDYGELQLSA